jgi:hypothetical protein
MPERLNFDKPKNVPQGGGYNADNFPTVYGVVEIMRWMTHKFGYYSITVEYMDIEATESNNLQCDGLKQCTLSSTIKEVLSTLAISFFLY